MTASAVDNASQLAHTLGADFENADPAIASVKIHEVHMASQRLWPRLVGIGIRFPRQFLAEAGIAEWEEPGEGIGLGFGRGHPFFGDLAGYEVVLRREECGQ